MTTALKTFDWAPLDKQFHSMTTNMLKWCKMVAAIPEHQEAVGERYGVSQPTVSQWTAIGNNYDRLITIGNDLPESYRTVYELTTLPEEAQTELLKESPRPTREVVLNFKRKLSHSEAMTKVAQNTLDAEAKREGRDDLAARAAAENPDIEGEATVVEDAPEETKIQQQTRMADEAAERLARHKDAHTTIEDATIVSHTPPPGGTGNSKLVLGIFPLSTETLDVLEKHYLTKYEDNDNVMWDKVTAAVEDLRPRATK